MHKQPFQFVQPIWVVQISSFTCCCSALKNKITGVSFVKNSTFWVSCLLSLLLHEKAWQHCGGARWLKIWTFKPDFIQSLNHNTTRENWQKLSNCMDVIQICMHFLQQPKRWWELQRSLLLAANPWNESKSEPVLELQHQLLCFFIDGITATQFWFWTSCCHISFWNNWTHTAKC